jgi:hypothetical protein
MPTATPTLLAHVDQHSVTTVDPLQRQGECKSNMAAIYRKYTCNDVMYISQLNVYKIATRFQLRLPYIIGVQQHDEIV